MTSGTGPGAAYPGTALDSRDGWAFEIIQVNKKRDEQTIYLDC